MALQGTIDAFPVVDVLHLLAGSRKTGRLIVEGDRSTAQLFVVEGAATGGGVQDTVNLEVADVVVELLRYSQGAFLFEPGSIAPDPSGPEDLMTLVAGAGQRLEQWAAIEAAVPSMSHRLSLVDTIASDDVTIAAAEWPLIVAAGAGARVDEAIEALGLPQLPACVMIAELADRQLVEVGPPSVELVHVPVTAQPVVAEIAEGPDTTGDAEIDDAAVIEDAVIQNAVIEDAVIEDAVVEDAATYEVVLMEEDDDDGTFPEHFPIDDLVGAAEEEDPWVLLETAGKEDRLAAAQSFDGDSGTAFSPGAFSSDGFSPADDGTSSTSAVPVDDARGASTGPAGGFTDAGAFTDPVVGATATVQGTAFVGDGAFTAEPLGSPVAVQAPDVASDTAADEVLRQMSKLSPKAAEAIAAALGSAAEDDPTS